MTDMGAIEQELAGFRRERHAALVALDPAQLLAVYEKYNEHYVAAGVKENWAKFGDEFMLTIMHKTRAAISEMPDELRHASIVWLHAHGYKARTATELAVIASHRRRAVAG